MPDDPSEMPDPPVWPQKPAAVAAAPADDDGDDNDSELSLDDRVAGLELDEATIRSLAEAGQIDAATALLIKNYGAELLGFLTAMARDTQIASEAFALGCEQIWRGLPRFRWQSAVRTWAYSVCRNALHQIRREPARRRERNLPLSVMTSMEAVPRTSTAPHHRTSTKQVMRELREALAPEDHELLLLRLDRGLSWKDIVRATSPDDPDGKLDQRAAALRKRFERVKAQLRALAVERGLIS